MRVKRDEWRGEVRHIHEIAELLDVSVVTNPAYPTAAVEYRSAPDPETSPVAPATGGTTKPEEGNMQAEDRQQAQETAAGGLQVADRVTVTATLPKGLAEAFRAAGFPGETATIDFDRFAESRAVTWTGSVDNINAVQAAAGRLGADQRFAWPVFPRVNVDSGATSVDVFTQTARSLAIRRERDPRD